MKNLLVATMLLISTNAHADKIDELLIRMMGEAFTTGCTYSAKHSIPNYDQKAIDEFCFRAGNAYKAVLIEELNKKNSGRNAPTPAPGPAPKTDDGTGEGTQISW